MEHSIKQTQRILFSESTRNRIMRDLKKNQTSLEALDTMGLIESLIELGYQAGRNDLISQSLQRKNDSVLVVWK